MSAADRPSISVVQTVASLDSVHGGVSRVVPQLADALTDVGCDVCVVTASDNPRSANPVLPMRARHLQAPAMSIAHHRLWSPQFAGKVAAGFTPHLPRVLHDNGLWGYTNFVAARVAAAHGIPLVISPHGMLEPWALREKRWRKRIALAAFQQRALESAALLVVTAQSEYDAVRELGFAQPIAVVPVGVALPATAAVHRDIRRHREMLFVSRIHPKKGLLSFLDAWRRVGSPDWHIIIAGPDEDGHLVQVRDRVERLGLQGQVEFRGEVAGDAKRKLFQSADIFVLPTFSENFGVVIAEAMSYGLPVLTTRGAPWSILPAINAGWWVEPGSDGLAEGLRTALSSTPGQRAVMGENGRAYVAANFGWPAAAELAYESYAWVLDRSRIRPSNVHLD